jgi:hypothetical protein
MHGWMEGWMDGWMDGWMSTHDMYAHTCARASAHKCLSVNNYLFLLQHGQLPEFTLLRNVEVLDLVV